MQSCPTECIVTVSYDVYRGPDEAEIMAHYYPLVQSYLQQQGQQQPQLPAEVLSCACMRFTT